MNSLIQDGWWRRLDAHGVTEWRHSDIPGWRVRQGRAPLMVITPEGELVTDNEGRPWAFQSLDEVYEFAKLALDPDGV